MNTKTKVILGITVAAAAGAAIGMLIASEKGIDLQNKIKESASDLLNEFSTLLTTGTELVSEYKIKIQPRIKEINSEIIELGV